MKISNETLFQAGQQVGSIVRDGVRLGCVLAVAHPVAQGITYAAANAGPLFVITVQKVGTVAQQTLASNLLLLPAISWGFYLANVYKRSEYEDPTQSIFSFLYRTS